MNIKSERVNISELNIGDLAIHWERIVKITSIDTTKDGYLITASESDDVGKDRFLRGKRDTIVRITTDEDIEA